MVAPRAELPAVLGRLAQLQAEAQLPLTLPAPTPAPTPAERSAELLSTADAARRLGLSGSTLAKRRVSGDGPRFRKLGARVLDSRVDLDAWAETHARASTA